MNRTPHRHAASIVRTVVLASATLAIVFVCYSVYQYTQLDEEAASRSAAPFAPLVDVLPPGDLGEGSVSLGTGGMQIGPVERPSVTIYPPEGTRAIGEIEADDWSPLPGSGNRVRLVNPFIRAETNDGRRLNIRADEAVIETSQPGGGVGRFDPRRGTLSGSVVIEIDRLTHHQREQLPADQRDVIDERRLIRIEMDHLEFDLEFSRVSIEGPFHVIAYEMSFEAGDLDIEFDPGASRIESITARGGGKLEMRGQGASLGLSLTPGSDEGTRSWSEALISRLSTVAKGESTSKSDASAPYVDEDGALVLVPDASMPEEFHEPIHYEAKFTDEVLVEQRGRGGSTARLRADVLTLLRAFTQADRDGGASASTRTAPAEGAGRDRSSEPRLFLSWSGPLSVRALASGANVDQPAGEQIEIVATGNPVWISDGQGDARCSKLVFNSVDQKIWLHGTRAKPVQMRSDNQGTIVAVSIVSQSRGDKRTIKAAGPGRLTWAGDTFDETRIRQKPSAGSDEVAGDSWVDFQERFEATIREVRHRGRFDLRSLKWTTEEKLVLDSAHFFGSVVMHQPSSQFVAQQVDMDFDSEASTTTIRRVVGKGRVTMTHGEQSKITCDRMEVDFDPRAGDAVPKIARAFGKIEAMHEGSIITAQERMDFVFRENTRPAAKDDLLKALNEALDAGTDLTAVARDVRRRRIAQRRRTDVELAQLLAYGAVSVIDPNRDLRLSAEQITCDFSAGNQIRSAVLNGGGRGAASVRKGTFSVTGDMLRANFEDEWVDVPGPGRMSFQLNRDLDGRPTDTPVTVVVSWSDWMKYRGRENRAVFMGNVHPVSDRTQIDSGRLEIEFEDTSATELATNNSGPPRGAMGLPGESPSRSGSATRIADATGLARKPTYFLATGGVTSEMSNVDELTGRLVSRARISGPRMSVDLRENVFMMRVEGEGKLLIEDYSHPSSPREGGDRRSKPVKAGALFDVGPAGASQTLITWKRLMFFDRVNERAQFEGQVRLDHFSGTFLVKTSHLASQATPGEKKIGREIRLATKVLSVDFVSAPRDGDREAPGVAQMSARRLEQFHANGSVRLTIKGQDQDQWLTAEELTYRKTRQLLFIQGSEDRPAEFITQVHGQPPRPVRASAITVNLATNRVDAQNPTYLGQ